MSYTKRLDRAFENAPVLPVNKDTKYVFFSDCHRGIGDNNDNFQKNGNNYFAALQYYYQYGYTYIEAGDGDELWENRRLEQIAEIHSNVFWQLSLYHMAGRLYMLYGNHDMVKRRLKSFEGDIPFYEGVILKSETEFPDIYVTHGHQADTFNSVFWRLSRFLVRYLWTPVEYFGVLDPTSAAKNNTKKEKIEDKLTTYAKNKGCILLTGHTHRPMLGNKTSPYYNCGSCVHPRCITCIELCGYNISLVKWHESAEKSGHFRNVYGQCPSAFPVYIKREVLTKGFIHP